MKKNRFLLLMFHIFIIFIVFFIINAIKIYDEKIQMKVLEATLIILYTYTLISSKCFLNWFSSYMIFLYTLFLFNFTRIFLDLVGYREFGWATKFANYYFMYEVRIEIIFVFILVILFTQLGFLISIQNENLEKLNEKVHLKNNELFTKIGLLLFYVSVLPLAYKMIIQLRAILKYGYEMYYTGILKTIEYPWFTKGAGLLFTIGYLIFIISVPKKKKYIYISSIYLIIKLVDSLKGARAVFLVQLLFVLWYYYKLYGVKIKFKTMLKLGSFTIVFSQILLSVRSKKIFSFDLFIGIAEFLYSQGVSYLVLGYTIDYKTRLLSKGSYPYILQGLFGFKPQSLNTLREINSLADNITYMLNPTAYLKGEGIGSNYIAEMYELGYIPMIIISVILGVVIIKYEKYLTKNRFLLMTSYYFIPKLFYMPRGSFFGDALIRNMLEFLVVYIVLNLCCYVIEKIKEKYNNDTKDNTLCMDRKCK